MFSKEESRQLRIDFWTAFGVYMRQYDPWYGAKQKWVNYHTGVKHIYFRLEAERGHVRVAVSLEHPDPGMRLLFYEQWEELKSYLSNLSGLEWEWMAQHELPDGRQVSSIQRVREGMSLFRKEDWPAMFEFLAQGITALDQVWADCNGVFKDLAS